VVIHAAMETRQTLNADTKKLADQIVKKFAQNRKNASSAMG
jgi:hypothetical protein